MTTPLTGSSPSHTRTGFRHWMDQVLEEAKRVEQGFAPEPVHDLRVALRRCRSMADSFRTIDPDPAWRAMKRAGGRVFRSLGDLRDVQVMREWVQRLAPLAEPAEPFPAQSLVHSLGHSLAQALDQGLSEREEALKRDAQTSLGRLDHDQWRKWADHLAPRVARVPIESPVFQYVALERWHEAYELHRRALRNRSKVSWHALRVGIKRFRYTAENFLPERHQRWGKDLKNLQDALGEVHDLDVLWEHIRAHGFDDGEMVSRWRVRIAEERGRRVENYRRKMVGPGSRWNVWRADLPQGTEQHQALLARAKTLVTFSGASVTHAQHVERLALQLQDGMSQAGVRASNGTDTRGSDARNILQLAAILEDVGHFRAKRGHHKRSYRILGKMAAPLGWSAESWEMVAALARYHRGALPEVSHAGFRKIPAGERRRFLLWAATLRLANVLDAGHARTVRSIKVVRTAETITLLASGYVEDPSATAEIAIAKHLLETACGLPVILRAAAVVKTGIPVKRALPRVGQAERGAVSKRRLALS